MKPFLITVTVLALLAAAPGALDAKRSGDKCSLEGTWYGFNTAGGDYVVTIARTGAKSYSGWLVSGSGPAHGEFVRQAGGKLRTTWMGYGDGPDFGYPAGTKVMYYMRGDGQMQGATCGQPRWTLTSTSSMRACKRIRSSAEISSSHCPESS